MSKKSTLSIEILSGPLDGLTVELSRATEWTRKGAGPLGFPWDEELGAPQARFYPDDQGWHLEAFQAPHGTYRRNTGERISRATLTLSEQDLLSAGNTWLLIKSLRPSAE